MIGKVTLQESVYITLEVNNIGYKIYVANPYSYMIDEEVKVYLYQQIKEDEHSLFGFRSIDERELFLKLISVKGVGPKIALPMFATGSINGIVDAIERENVLYLTKFPKIGKKTAQQIILDLSGKFTAEGQMTLGETPAVLSNGNQELEDGLAALDSLGYSAKEISKVKSQLEKENLKSADEYLRAGLKLLS